MDGIDKIIDKVLEEFVKFERLQMEHKEQTLTEIITTYDFIVGWQMVFSR